MVPTVWVLAAFLAGTATGALVISILRMATLSRIREEFEAQLQALVESRVPPVNDKPQLKQPGQAA